LRIHTKARIRQNNLFYSNTKNDHITETFAFFVVP